MPFGVQFFGYKDDSMRRASVEDNGDPASLSTGGARSTGNTAMATATSWIRGLSGASSISEGTSAAGQLTGPSGNVPEVASDGQRDQGQHVGRGKGDYKLMTSYTYVGEGNGDYDQPDPRSLVVFGVECPNPAHFHVNMLGTGKLWNYIAGGAMAFGLAGLLYILTRIGSHGSFLQQPYSCELGTPDALSTWGPEQKAFCCRENSVACEAATTERPWNWDPYTTSGIDVPQAAQIRHECPGGVDVAGVGKAWMVNAALNTPSDLAKDVEVGSAIIPHMKGRTYFATGCTTDYFDYRKYMKLPLLGKSFKYTVDLSAAKCGCNAALYLTNLRQNHDVGTCGDYYCDANKVCGVNCAEIDIMEANQDAFYSTLHVQDDGGGVGGGYGAGRRDWNASAYGPDAHCINTNYPFQVAAHFPVDDGGNLLGMQVTLTQIGGGCPLSTWIQHYTPGGRDGLSELTDSLAAGMTPIVSYWGEGANMAWMDGRGGDGKGPCKFEEPDHCGASVKMYDFILE